MKKLLLFSVLFHVVLFFNCSEKEKERFITYRYQSEAIDKESYFLVFTPRGEKEPSPVLYLLTGYGGTPDSWTLVADLSWMAVEYEMYIISIASGTHPYVNDQLDTTKRYEDYVLEIIDRVDQSFNTRAVKGSRGICGISMGGGGALFLAGKHHDMFNSASALSAGSLSPVYTALEGLKNVTIMFDCGQQDDLLEDNRYLHTLLTEANVAHQYFEFPGEHNELYWASRSQVHLEFHAVHFIR